MKKLSLLLLTTIVLTSFVLADLSDFPDNFFSGDRFDGYIVVGKDGSPFDVISQSTIATKINVYRDVPQKDIVKLDDEVDMDNNLILIGTPCANKLTAELMGNPSPCDKDFLPGKAYIGYYEKNGNKYLVVASIEGTGTRKAAQYLADFSNDLKGTEVILDTGSDEKTTKTEETTSSPPVPPSGVIAHPPNQVSDNEDAAQEDKKADIRMKSDINKSDDAPKVIIVQDKGFFRRLFDWFSGLFGK